MYDWFINKRRNHLSIQQFSLVTVKGLSRVYLVIECNRVMKLPHLGSLAFLLNTVASPKPKNVHPGLCISPIDFRPKRKFKHFVSIFGTVQTAVTGVIGWYGFFIIGHRCKYSYTQLCQNGKRGVLIFFFCVRADKLQENLKSRVDIITYIC